MKILILGRTETLYNTAINLSASHDICGIITSGAMPEYSKNEKDFEKLARKLKTHFLLTKSLDEKAKQFIKKVKPDIAVSINWVSIIRQDVIDLIPGGILNAHCGDLPAYRGNAVINWAILNNEPEIALTIHYMEAGNLDSGDILIQKKMQLNNTTTIKDIVDFVNNNVPGMYEEVVNNIELKKINAIKQSERGIVSFRCYPRLPSDSKIDWNKSAAEIDRLIRASTKPYSGAYSYIKLKGVIRKIFIWESRLAAPETKDVGSPGHIIKNDSESGESWVYTGKGILAVKKAQFEKGGEFEPGKKLKSIRIRFGIDIEEEIIKLYSKIK